MSTSDALSELEAIVKQTAETLAAEKVPGDVVLQQILRLQSAASRAAALLFVAVTDTEVPPTLPST